MFFVLRKIVIGIMLALLLLFAWFLYEQRRIFTPAVDLAIALNNRREVETTSAGTINGKVTHVTGPNSFILRADDGQTYRITLKAVQPLANAQNSLSNLLLSSDVRVDLSFLQQHNGIGVAHLGKTNINALLIESGAARLQREYLKGLPVLDQYQLLRVDRKAQRRTLHARTEENLP
jgi:hypothetical protein